MVSLLGKNYWKRKTKKLILKNESVVEINNENTNSIVKYITYALVGVVLLVMIIVIWGNLSSGVRNAQGDAGAKLSITSNKLNDNDRGTSILQGKMY